MERIIVPTDFSECAGFAENAAIEIAKKCNARLTFLHGIHAASEWSPLVLNETNKNPAQEKQINLANRELEDRVNVARSHGVAAHKSLVFLYNSKNLVHAIMEDRHDLIVLGSHGKGSLKKIWVGSNTGKILRTCKAPVLVLQNELTRPLHFHSIVFASGLEPDTHQALDLALKFAKTMQVKKQYFVGVTTPNSFKPTSLAMAEMKSFLSRHEKVGMKIINYNHYNIEAGILEFAHQVKADLIAISNHGRTDIAGLFIESIPENLVKYAEIPLLSIRV